jgi:inosine/xanthosine triphosphatase
MILNVGSTNKSKVEALEEIIQEYPHLKGAKIAALDVSSEISDQPKSLEETMLGAMNRARNAFKDCAFSFGLESGLMSVPNIKTGCMDVCVCAIFDGKEYFFGLSSAWEVPKKVMEHMNNGMNMTDAALKAGFSTNPKLGAAEGLIGVVTKGRLTRKSYTKEAIRTALIHLEQN